MRYYPVFLDFDGADVLVVGGGEIAARKLRLIARTPARLTVLAPAVCPEVGALIESGRAVHVGRRFADADVDRQQYVVAATNDAAVNRQVAAACQARNVPVNVVDDAEACTAITPAIVDRSPIIVAIGTEGSAPVIARRLREQFEQQLSPALGRIASFIQRHRPRVNAEVAPDLRRRVWEAMLDGPGAAALEAGQPAEADTELTRILAALEHGKPASAGHVALVGAGPGAADLLTLRALRLMQDADVVLHDRLVPAAVLELVRRDAERIDVGKQKDRHPVPQGRINQLLIEQARGGKRVVRLKGGDPFVFGRGGEEISELAAAGITFEVVPGVTAANACAAYAGIPLTHRDHAQSVIFVTGHRQKNGDLDLPWDCLARAGQTVVIYMGLGSLGDCMQGLMAAGCPADRPVAVVQSGATDQQAVRIGRVDTIADAAASMASPSLVIVGDVVALHATLGWYAADVPHTT